MEFHQLRYVCAIAETGSFSRAAERCQVAQPSLSQQVLKLEEDLGAKLFDRLGRSVRLTEAGRAFVSHARAILEKMDLARASVSEKNADLRGSVSVGVICSAVSRSSLTWVLGQTRSHQQTLPPQVPLE